MTTISHPELEGLDRYKFDWADSDTVGASARRGLSEEVVRDISAKKSMPPAPRDRPGRPVEPRCASSGAAPARPAA
jgi:hypothetical protein